MSGKWLELLGFVAVAAVGLVGTGCAESAVGDPCVPEQVPEGGFLASETYLETSSVQCATRVCLVRELAGDPNNVEPECPGGTTTCVSPSDVERSVYCSCRCGAPEGSGLPTCGCPGGFLCEEILETGGDGLRGSYCVRDPTLEVQ
ncbi:MAG: hypothetical protein OEM15_15935 [Myxococcales bacterium]|nr:hypothetical protein [Myxococcales bacterium]MDH3483411.1 hypothetical protein [Myxococcales bacterium]